MPVLKRLTAWLRAMPADRRRVVILLAVIVLGALYGAYRVCTYDPNYVIKVDQPDRMILKTEKGLYLIGVQCPPYMEPKVGKPAQEFVTSRVLNRYVRIEPGERPEDDANWLLVYMFYMRDGKERFLNEDLLRLGYGRLALRAPNLKYRRVFEDAQAEAMREKRGIWAPGYRFPGD